MNTKRLEWFANRIGKTVWMTRQECNCKECANGYINGIRIMNALNAEGLFHVEEDHKDDEQWPVLFFETWQERNEWEAEHYDESPRSIIMAINKLNDQMNNGELEDKHIEIDREKSRTKLRLIPRTVDKKPGRNDQCPCGSGKKYKKCCLNGN